MIICGTGHRPHKLGGSSSPLRQAVITAARKKVESYTSAAEIISGMALGFDQDLAQIAVDLGIPLTAAIPFVEQPMRWPPIARREYDRLLQKAKRIVVVSALVPRCGFDAARKLNLRNEWMLAQLDRARDVVLAAWDGSPGGTANCYAIAEARGLTIDRIDPRGLVMP